MDEQELAKALHDVLCQWNHTDGCGWYYEMTDRQDNWNGRTHMRYRAKAREFIETVRANGIDITVGQLATLIQLVKHTRS